MKKYWTKEKCSKIAKEFETRTEFFKAYPGGYRVGRTNNWLDEICSHMKSTRKPKGFWTKEKCSEIAKEFETRTEFFETHPTAYNVSQRNGWLDEICFHMNRIRKPKGFWTIDKCREYVRLCETRIEFQRRYATAYVISQRNNWLNEIFSK